MSVLVAESHPVVPLLHICYSESAQLIISKSMSAITIIMRLPKYPVPILLPLKKKQSQSLESVGLTGNLARGGTASSVIGVLHTHVIANSPLAWLHSCPVLQDAIC